MFRAVVAHLAHQAASRTGIVDQKAAVEDGEVDTDVIRTSVVCAVDGIASPSHEDFGIVVVEGAMRVRQRRSARRQSSLEVTTNCLITRLGRRRPASPHVLSGLLRRAGQPLHRYRYLSSPRTGLAPIARCRETMEQRGSRIATMTTRAKVRSVGGLERCSQRMVCDYGVGFRVS